MSSLFKTIVVGTDFTASAAGAAAAALRLANTSTAVVHLVHVVDDGDMAELLEIHGGVSRETLCEQLRSAAMERVEAALAQADPDCLVPRDRIQCEAVVGDPLIDLLNYITDVSADLLVIGSGARPELSLRTGELAARLVRKANCAVMLVRVPPPATFATIVACADLSDLTHRVLEAGVDIANRDHAELHVVHLFRPPRSLISLLGDSTLQTRATSREYEERAHVRLSRAIESIPAIASLPDARRHIVECADHKAGLLEFLEARGASLAVVGSHGRRGWKTVLMGSTAEFLVRRSDCSVLILKPQDFRVVLR